MPKYRDPSTGTITDVSAPELNPNLIAGKTLVPEGTPLSTNPQGNVVITADMLKTAEPMKVATPTPTPTTSASSVDATVPTPTTETPLSSSEKRVSDLIAQITGAQTAATGKTAFQTEQYKAQNIAGLTTAQEDIANQILMLQAQEKNVEAQIQKESEGRGRTAAGIAPLTASAKRDIGIQTNVLSAQLLASQNKLASAKARIDQAVLEKFGPQEEDIKAKLANLEQLLKDPALSKAEKDRANAQALTLKAKEEEIAQKKVDNTNIWTISTTAASNIASFKPSGIYTTAAETLQAIQKAPTPEAALAIATVTGLTKPPTALSDYEQAVLRDKGRLPTVAELTAYKATSTSISETEKTRALKQSAFKKAQPALEAAKGRDGFVDPKKYMQLRIDYGALIGDVADFDAMFSSYLSPQQRVNLGVKNITGFMPEDAPILATDQVIEPPRKKFLGIF